MDSLSLQNALKYSGYLEKKSPSMFGGWQKRFFKVLEGKVLTYSEKEKDKEFKGSINLEEVTGLKATDKKCFQFTFGDRKWDLRAESDVLRDSWLKVINLLLNEIQQNKSLMSRPTVMDDDLPEGRNRGQSLGGKIWKKNKQDLNTMEILKKSGFTDKDDELSEQAICVKIKNLNIQIPEIKSRIQFGFLMKKHKKDYLFQKRWFFIISSRPLNDVDYEKDDQMIYKNPSGTLLDTLYYFTFDNESDDSKAKGDIPMSDCSELAAIDKDSKFFLIVDMGDRKYEFQTDVKSERDKWYTCLKNSRKTAKEIKKSYTKKPRNISRLLKIIENEGIGKLREICEKEKDGIVQNYKDIKEFDLLEGYYIKGLQDLLYQTLDACVISEPSKTEIIKTYVETFNTSYLILIQKFWSNCYVDMDQSQIVKLASLLFTHEETLIQYGVNDPNFSQNARELIKIFIKKTFLNVKTIIESILKSEREVKAVKSTDNLLITNGPVDLFKMLYSLIDVFKKENYKIKYVIEQLLNLCKECIIQYLVGVDCVISKTNLEIDKEFLIGVANNSLKINSQFEDLLDEIKSMQILNDKEVEDASGEKEITSSLTLISNNSISRFVLDLSDALASEFQEHFFALELNKILDVTFQTYGMFTNYMHVSIQKKCWNEVLKATLFQYIKSLLTTAHKKVKNIEELTKKLRDDKEILIGNYTRVLGENVTRETLKILDDFLDFLDVSPEMISVSCTKLREFNGPSFTVNTAKALINLRCDLMKDDKNEAISSCKEILEKWQGGEGKKSNGFLDNLDLEIKNNRDEEDETEYMEEVEETPKDKRRKTMNLTDFLNIGVDVGDLDDESNKEENAPKTFEKSVSEIGIVSDVIMEGIMKKKTYNKWQERFFQIKNSTLYWYKNKNSKESQNNIPITEIKKVIGHKPCKFVMACGEKVYKFSCETDEEKESWIKALNNEIKKLRGDFIKKIETLCEIKLKKKVIVDFYDLPNINSEKMYMKNKVDEAIKGEDFFGEKKKSKPQLKPNTKIVENKAEKIEDIVRSKQNDTNSSFGGGNITNETKIKISPLNIGLIDKKPKNTSIFSCCTKLMMKFSGKKQRSIQDYEN